MLRQAEHIEPLDLDTKTGRISGLGVLWRDASKGEHNTAFRAFERGDFKKTLKNRRHRERMVLGWDHLEGASMFSADSDKAIGTFNLPDGFGVVEGEKGLEFEAQIVPWPPVTTVMQERMAKVDGGVIVGSSIGWEFAKIEVRGNVEDKSGDFVIPIIGGPVERLFEISLAVFVVEEDTGKVKLQNESVDAKCEAGVFVTWQDDEGRSREGIVISRDEQSARVMLSTGGEQAVDVQRLAATGRMPLLTGSDIDDEPEPIDVSGPRWQSCINALQSNPVTTSVPRWAAVIDELRK